MGPGNPNVAADVVDLLARNRESLKHHEPIDFFSERPPNSPMPKVFIFCCFDPRVDPVKFLGLNPWDALLVRNAGGNVLGSLEHLIFVDHLLGSFTDIMVIHHTDCGTTMAKGDDIREGLKTAKHGTDLEVEHLRLPDTDNIQQRLRDNVDVIKHSHFIRDELKARTIGLLYDLKSGQLQHVAGDYPADLEVGGQLPVVSPTVQ